MKCKKGFTVIELLVVVSIIALLIGILLPAIGKARDAALVTQSLTNLRNMGTAHAIYAGEYNGRQFTLCPDDLGAFSDNATTPAQAGMNYDGNGCPPPLFLGFDTGGGLWGYYLPCQDINVSVSPWANMALYVPIDWNSPQIGSYRMANCKIFNTYVNGRFYDEVFYAPKDEVILEQVEPFFEQAAEFTQLDSVDNDSPIWSSYTMSPAAMFHPDVMRHGDDNNDTDSHGWQNPYSLPAGCKSPSPDQASYPDLKTRMIEHHWLQNAQADVNPAIAGGNTPFFFNAAFSSAPATLFYDGNVRIFGVSQASASDKQVYEQTAQSNNPGVVRHGLWNRTTPLGGEAPDYSGPPAPQGGFFQNIAYDDFTNSSYHILTNDGILGRDSTGFGTG